MLDTPSSRVHPPSAPETKQDARSVVVPHKQVQKRKRRIPHRLSGIPVSGPPSVRAALLPATVTLPGGYVMRKQQKPPLYRGYRIRIARPGKPSKDLPIIWSPDVP